MQELLKQNITANDTIIIGVSGGPDSIYLLLQTLRYTKNIIVAHVIHPQRKIGSKRDALFVENFAKKCDVLCETTTISPKKHGNAEEYYRYARYDFFEKLRKKHKAKWILTGHHLNDNIETVLFNLTKGSFTQGLSGMQPVDEQRHLLRPLLLTPKSEILEHLKKTKTPYMKDRTNKDTRLHRNLLRHKVLPKLRTINQNLEQTFAQNLANLQELHNYIEQETRQWLASNYQENCMSLKNFKALHPILQKNVLHELHRAMHGPTRGLSQNHLKQLLKIIHQPKGNTQKEFGKNYKLKVTRANGQKVIMLEKKP